MVGLVKRQPESVSKPTTTCSAKSTPIKSPEKKKPRVPDVKASSVARDLSKDMLAVASKCEPKGSPPPAPPTGPKSSPPTEPKGSPPPVPPTLEDPPTGTTVRSVSWMNVVLP